MEWLSWKLKGDKMVKTGQLTYLEKFKSLNKEQLASLGSNWTILNKVGIKSRMSTVLCRCVCGKEKYVIIQSLFSKKSTGCRSCALKTHGETKKSVLYTRWRGMIGRCRREKNYADRGILVCEEWKDYLVFKKWAIDNGFRKELTIDRINNNGNYSPSNCRWVDIKTQSRNTRLNLRVNGTGKVAIQLSEESGIPYHRVRKMIHNGLSEKEILESVKQ